MDSRRMLLMDLLAGQKWRRRHREQTCGCRLGRRGRDNWREGVETYSPRVKQRASGDSLHELSELRVMLCDGRRWDGVECGRGFPDGGDT